jgi:DNA-directed RNA polymerase subunit RPC12/RpoP
MSSTLKSILVIALLVAVITVASYHAIKALKRRSPEEEGMGYTAVLMCRDPECQKVFEGRIIAGQPPPYPCKYCGKMTAYRAVQCQRCGKIFPNIVPSDPTRPGVEELRTRECPYCGSTRFDLVDSMDQVRKSLPGTE